VSAWAWAWIAVVAAFLGVELSAAFATPKQGHTASEIIWRWTRGRGRLHWLARFGLVAGLAWLSLHLLSGGWV
jgi:hypothetical protein